MAFRTFNGRWYSENGWPYVDEGSCTWIVVPGTDPPVHLQIQNGQSLAIMRAWAADFNAFVEHLRDADSACWTPGNKVATSNHPGGTAMDLNWDSHGAGGARNAGFNAAQVATIREMLSFYEGMMYWGNDWNSFIDPMHFQMGYNTYDQDAKRPFPKVDNFIARKIRADGFSTFRRGGTPAPQPNMALVLSNATGITLAKATVIAPQVSDALVKSNCTTPRRIAAALAQWVIESGHFVYTEEIASGPESEERWKYKGRTWIQLTWLENYSGFSKWCHGLGLVPSPDYFVVRPRELAELKWAALGPAYWWSVKYPKINEYADRGDIDNVSKWVNAPAWVDNPNKHANGEAARREAYNRALAVGNDLLILVSAQPSTGEDDWLNMPNNQEKLDAIFNALFTPQPPENIYRDADDQGLSLVAAIRSILSMLYEGTVERLALEGEQASIDKVVRTAKGLAVEQRPWAIARANLVWNLGRTGSATPPPISPRPQLYAEPIDAPVLPTPETPQVLPALPVAANPITAEPIQEYVKYNRPPESFNYTPMDYLNALQKLDEFNREYRARFDQLTKTEDDPKEAK